MSRMTENVRQTVARNIIAKDEWVLIDLSKDVPFLVSSRVLDRSQGVKAVSALRGHIEGDPQ